MKLYSEEIAGSDKKRTLLAVGKDEAELLWGLVNKALNVWPTGIRWSQDRARLTNMSREFRKYLEEEKDES